MIDYIAAKILKITSTKTMPLFLGI